MDQLEIQSPPSINYGNDLGHVMKNRSFGSTRSNGEIWVHVGNRNVADICRTLCHELIHHSQFEKKTAYDGMDDEQTQKIEDEAIDAQLHKLEKSKQENLSTISNLKPMKDGITFDDFSKMDIRIGTILSAERVPKADKLLKLLVDTGIDQRTVVSGIAQHFEPEAIVGKQVTVVVNLAPRKMRGIESNGMILMAEDANGKLHFVNPSDNINPGSGVS
jgi:methionine--tRNA ligase beta chain